MAKRNSTKKPNIAICAGLVMLCLTLFSIHMTSGLYARYVSKDSAEDSARVAKFDVKVTGDNTSKDLTVSAEPSSTNQYLITVSNKSEVAVHYKMQLQFNSGDTTGIEYKFTPSEGDLAVNEQSTSTLMFSVDWATFTENKTSLNGAVTVNIGFTVVVDTVQVD